MSKPEPIAEAVRKACLEAAMEGYQQAGLAGLCAEGREEMALDAIRSLDLEAVLQAMHDTTGEL